MELLFVLLIIYSSHATDELVSNEPADARQATVPDRLFLELYIGGNCEWELPSEAELPPVFVVQDEDTGEYTISKPVHSLRKNQLTLRMDFQETLTLVCPSSGEESTVLLSGKCSWMKLMVETNNDMIKYDNLKKFTCSTIDFKEKESDQNKCTTPGPERKTILAREIGFMVEGKWIPIVEYCSEPQLALTFYTKHRLFGQLKYNNNENGGRVLSNDLETALSNSRQQQVAVVTKYSLQLGLLLFGRDYSADHFILVRGIPLNDIVIKAEEKISDKKELQFFIWKSIYEQRLVPLENLVRDFASKSNGEIYVTTGTFSPYILEDLLDDSTMKLEDILGKGNNAENQPLEIGTRRIMKYLWKIVQLDDACVVFIVKNKRNASDPPLCENSCTTMGWKNLDGVSCCPVQELIGIFPGIFPQSVTATCNRNLVPSETGTHTHVEI